MLEGAEELQITEVVEGEAVRSDLLKKLYTNLITPSFIYLKDKNLYVHMIGLLRKKNLLPVIVFTFSKKKCEEYANALINIDLTSGGSEKSEIHVFCERSLNRLKGTDRELPQVLRMRELLSRGIGVHHGGLLPIIKEVR